MSRSEEYSRCHKVLEKHGLQPAGTYLVLERNKVQSLWHLIGLCSSFCMFLGGKKLNTGNTVETQNKGETTGP